MFKNFIKDLFGFSNCSQGASRRGFLRTITGAAVGVVAAPFLKFFPSLETDREAILAEMLKTEEVRIALAQSMVSPIRMELNYQAVGRKIFMVDDLPQCALARYERDVPCVAHVFARGDIPTQIIEGEEVFVPAFRPRTISYDNYLYSEEEWADVQLRQSLASIDGIEKGITQLDRAANAVVNAIDVIAA